MSHVSYEKHYQALEHLSNAFSSLPNYNGEISAPIEGHPQYVINHNPVCLESDPGALFTALYVHCDGEKDAIKIGGFVNRDDHSLQKIVKEKGFVELVDTNLTGYKYYETEIEVRK